MQNQGYYNNQTNYPMQPGYGYGQPVYGQYPAQQVIPVQTQPNTVVIREQRKSGDDGLAAGCCAGCCAACLAMLCCCCMAAAGGGGRHRGRF